MLDLLASRIFYFRLRVQNRNCEGDGRCYVNRNYECKTRNRHFHSGKPIFVALGSDEVIDENSGQLRFNQQQKKMHRVSLLSALLNIENCSCMHQVAKLSNSDDAKTHTLRSSGLGLLDS